MELVTLIHSYACLKSMRKLYLSLVCTAGFTDAHLLLFENEATWARSNSLVATCTCNSTQPPYSSELESSTVTTTEQLLQAGNGSRVGARYVVRLDGLFYAGVSHANAHNRLSVTAAIKSAFEKFVSSTSVPSMGLFKDDTRQPSQHQPSTKMPTCPVGRAESCTSIPGPGPASSTGDNTSLCLETSSSSHPRRPASICGVPLLSGLDSTHGSTNSGVTSIGLFFQDGSSTIMSFKSPDLVGVWLQALSAVIATNKSRSSYPHIEYASSVTCKFKAKDFNAGPFPKIKGECIFCLSKLDVLLISESIKQPDLAIRFPYVRHCASRDDGRLCLNIGRAAPTGECELVLQMPNAREAKAAHTKCITLMRQCPTWLKLGRDGPSSRRRRTILGFGKKLSGVKLEGPPLPRISAVVSTSESSMPGSSFDPHPSVPGGSLSSGIPSLTPPPILHTTPPSYSYSLSHLSVRLCRHHILSRKSKSFPSHLCTQPIPEVAVDENSAGDITEPAVVPASCHTMTAERTVTPCSCDTPSASSVAANATTDLTSHYLQLEVDSCMGPHIKSIAKYTPPEGTTRVGLGPGQEQASSHVEAPSEETIHHVLAYLSSITRPSKAPCTGTAADDEGTQPLTLSRQPTVKFSPNPLMIPADQPLDGFYVEQVVAGIDRPATKVGGSPSDLNQNPSVRKTPCLSAYDSGDIQLRRSKLQLATQAGASVSCGSTSKNRNRIYSHRDNDELFANLTYVPAATSRQATFAQMSTSFETTRMSMLVESPNNNSQNRPRTSSDTGSKWKSGVTGPLRLFTSTSQMISNVSRPRARSLTQQLATKPLSQPIGVKDIEGITTFQDNSSSVMDLGARSGSTTSTSKGIMRAIEQVLGRPRSIAEGEGLQGCGNSDAVGSSASPAHHSHLQNSEIYADMDFTVSRQPHLVYQSTDECNTPCGPLFASPPDSFSLNSSSLSFYGFGGVGSKQILTRTATTTVPGINFNDHYSIPIRPPVVPFIDPLAPTLSPQVSFLKKPLNGCDSS